MVEIADIKNQESLQVWMQRQPEVVHIWIAHRNAMRVLPLWWSFLLADKAAKGAGLTALPVLRSNFVLGIARKIPTPDIKQAAASAAVSSAKSPDIRDAAAMAADAAASAVAVDAVVVAAVYAIETLGSDTAASMTADAADYAYVGNAVTNTDAYWEFIRQDCAAITSGGNLDGLALWGVSKNPLVDIWADIKQQMSTDASTDWSFWVKWYDDALAGNPPNWDMLERIALIDPKDWDKGAEVVNPLIAEIVAEYDDKTSAVKEFDSTNVSPAAKKMIVGRVQKNREVLALSIAGVLEQISEFSERIRGINHLDTAYRESIFEYLEGLSEQLTDLLGHLPDDNQLIEEAQVEKLVTWGQKFRHSFVVEAKKYAAPNNVAGAAVPTGIILGCSAIGACFGPWGAGVGGVIGKLITGELKPAKAADALTENDDPSEDE